MSDRLGSLAEGVGTREVDRRTLLRTGLVATVAGTLSFLHFGEADAAPAREGRRIAAPAKSPVAVQAYHGVSAAQHQAHFTQLSAEGYGMISLSVYGDPSDAQYAAVWVKRPMPSWVAVHGISASDYQSWFDKWSAQGYASELLTVAGPAQTPSSPQ